MFFFNSSFFAARRAARCIGLNGKVVAVGFMLFSPRFGGQRGTAGDPCKKGRVNGNLALAIDDIMSGFCVRLSRYGLLLLMVLSLVSGLRSVVLTDDSSAAGLLRSRGASSVSSLMSSSLVSSSNGLYGIKADDLGGVGGNMLELVLMMSFS